MGAILEYNDPFFPAFPKTRKYDYILKYTSITKKTLKTFDCIVLVTDHDQYEYDLIKDNSKLIIDTRGKFYPSDNIVRA